MPKVVGIDAKTFLFDGMPVKVGSYLEVINPDFCRTGATIRVKTIIGKGDCVEIGIYSNIAQPGWHDLDGRVSNGHGYWMDRKSFVRFLRPKDILKYVVSGDIKYKNISLKGMRCKILHSNYNDTHCFVELEKDVGGGSGDGTGKKGHCIVLDGNILEIDQPKKKEKV